jgi:hypothetical protein
MARVTVEPRAAALLALAGLAGCGGGGGRTPSLSAVPLVDGAQVVAQVRSCDKGANAFCALEVVVADPRYQSSAALLDSQHRLLLASGWTGANADIGEEHAAESPGHKLRLTYAPAFGDLKGIDLGWIKRSKPIALALSRILFERRSAMSLLVEIGAG